MTTFQDRERAFENKFAHDAEMKFKAEARRNRLVGLWAAELMGRDAEAAQAYAREIVKVDFAEAGDHDVLRKLCADLDGISDEATIRAKMDEFLARAKAQLVEEY